LAKYLFNIDLLEIFWLERFDDPDDRCAHGKVSVTIGSEIVACNSADPDDWWTLSAMALHLLRTLETNHTKDAPVAACLVPGEGHHIDHEEDSPIVHIETAYPMADGRNWWVRRSGNEVTLETEAGCSTTLRFEDYKQQVLSFVDIVEDFYKCSTKKNLPDNTYDRTAYLKFWTEWTTRRSKWNQTA
jgi:hypothetical protein